jgi:hypothetical protein
MLHLYSDPWPTDPIDWAQNGAHSDTDIPLVFSRQLRSHQARHAAALARGEPVPDVDLSNLDSSVLGQEDEFVDAEPTEVEPSFFAFRERLIDHYWFRRSLPAEHADSIRWPSRHGGVPRRWSTHAL